MAWGFGNHGYGPRRTNDILASAEPAEVRASLEGLISASRRNPADAWDAIKVQHRIKGLGAAFGTKVAYFAAFSDEDASQLRPLIADLNTSWAMWDLCRLPRSVERRSSYLQYVDLAHAWADALDCRPDDIELALFEHGKRVLARWALGLCSRGLWPGFQL